MGLYNVIPTQNSFSPLGSGGGGGIWNNTFLPSIAAGTQGQSSGGFNTIPGMSSPSMPDWGNLFPANGVSPQNPFDLFGGSTIPGSGSMFPNLPQVRGKDLRNLYGKGVGDALAQFLNSGAGFNPAVIQAQQNAARPLEARGIETIMNAMGVHGLGSSSTAALGIGDFESQFNAQLQNMFAQEYEQSVQNYLNVLMGVKGDAKEQQAQKGSIWSFLGGAAGSLIPFLFGDH